MTRLKTPEVDCGWNEGETEVDVMKDERGPRGLVLMYDTGLYSSLKDKREPCLVTFL